MLQTTPLLKTYFMSFLQKYHIYFLKKPWILEIFAQSVIKLSLFPKAVILQGTCQDDYIYVYIYQIPVQPGLIYKHLCHLLIIHSMIQSLILCGNIFISLSFPNRKSQGAEILRKYSPPPCITSHMSCVRFQVSCVRCHVLGVMCQVSCVTCHI